MILHKWLGLALSLWLLLISISGTLLLFKTPLLQWQYPELHLRAVPTVQETARLFDYVSGRYAYFPTERHPWIEVVDEADSHHYYSGSGDLLLSRPPLGDWIDWMVELHHHLLLGKFGEQLQGVLGLASLMLVASGLIKWWPAKGLRKKDFSVRLARPGHKHWGQTLWQSHRTLAVVLFLPMVLALATGTAMIYHSAVQAGFEALFPQPGKVREPAVTAPVAIAGNWSKRLVITRQLMATAEPRLAYLNTGRLRLAQPEEWHPNGRSSITFGGQGRQVVNWHDTREQTLGYRLAQTVYPLHIAAVGGNFFLTAVTLGGTVLVFLTVTGVWFWIWRGRRRPRRNR